MFSRENSLIVLSPRKSLAVDRVLSVVVHFSSAHILWYGFYKITSDVASKTTKTWLSPEKCRPRNIGFGKNSRIKWFLKKKNTQQLSCKYCRYRCVKDVWESSILSVENNQFAIDAVQSQLNNEKNIFSQDFLIKILFTSTL